MTIVRTIEQTAEQLGIRIAAYLNAVADGRLEDDLPCGCCARLDGRMMRRSEAVDQLVQDVRR